MGAGRQRWARRLLDLAAYAIGVTLVVTVSLVPPSLLAGAGLVGVKYGLFLVGVLSFGYATVLLWPSRPGHLDDGRGDGQQAASEGAGKPVTGNGARNEVERRDESRFETLIVGVPPFDRYRIPPVDRFHPGTKLYVASLLMLAVSYVMEAVFGVRT